MDSTSYIGSSTALSSSFATTANTNATTLRPFANLDLTEAQRSQIRTIAQNAKTANLSASQLQGQIERVLTPQQQAMLQADQTSGAASGTRHHHVGGSSASAAASSQNAVTDPLTILGQDATSSTISNVNGLTLEDLQNQAAAGDSLAQQQLASELFSTGTTEE